MYIHIYIYTSVLLVDISINHGVLTHSSFVAFAKVLDCRMALQKFWIRFVRRWPFQAPQSALECRFSCLGGAKLALERRFGQTWPFQLHLDGQVGPGMGVSVTFGRPS